MISPEFIQTAFKVIATCFIIFIFFSVSYKKAPPDTAYIISGVKKRILVGRAGLRIPFFERMDVLSLKLIQIDVKTQAAVPTADYIGITVDATVNVKIPNDKAIIEIAAQNFLNQKEQYIQQTAREVLEGNVREIIGKMKLEELVGDRQKFAEEVTNNAKPDLRNMGLEIISFNVQSFADENDVIVNLGIDNIEQIRKNAAIAKAGASRDIDIAEAKAKQEARQAQVEADKDIAEREQQLNIRKSELKEEQDVKTAQADAAYKIEEQRQRQNIEVASVEADTARQEKEAELKQQEVVVREKVLDAEIRKQADADLYKRRQDAEAEKAERMANAEASKYEQEQQALAKEKVADADLYAKQKEAEGIAAVGKAQAEAIKAQGMAEAEAMEKKAEAYAKYNNAAVTEMVIRQLPDIAKAIAEPLQQIDKITVIDTGSGEGAAQVSGYVPAILRSVMEATKEVTGFDLTDVMKANTYDAKVNKRLEYSGDPMVQVNMNEVSGSDDRTAEAPVAGDDEKLVDHDGTSVHG